MRTHRTAAILVSLPLMAFTCANVQQLSVLAEPKRGHTLEVLSNEYAGVVGLVTDWADKKGAQPVDCGVFMGFRANSPGCHGFKLNDLRVSVLFVPAENRTEIEFFEFQAAQSQDSKAAQLELSALMKTAFGESRVKEGPFWWDSQ